MYVASNSNTMTTAMGTPGRSRAMALALGGADDEAAAVCRDSSPWPKLRRNPHALSTRTSRRRLGLPILDPTTAIAALQQALKIARESGNRFNESHIAVTLSELEVHTRRSRIRVRPPHAGDSQLPRLGQHRDSTESVGHPRHVVGSTRSL